MQRLATKTVKRMIARHIYMALNGISVWYHSRTSTIKLLIPSGPSVCSLSADRKQINYLAYIDRIKSFASHADLNKNIKRRLRSFSCSFWGAERR